MKSSAVQSVGLSPEALRKHNARARIAAHMYGSEMYPEAWASPSDATDRGLASKLKGLALEIELADGECDLSRLLHEAARRIDG